MVRISHVAAHLQGLCSLQRQLRVAQRRPHALYLARRERRLLLQLAHERVALCLQRADLRGGGDALLRALLVQLFELGLEFEHHLRQEEQTRVSQSKM